MVGPYGPKDIKRPKRALEPPVRWGLALAVVLGLLIYLIRRGF